MANQHMPTWSTSRLIKGMQIRTVICRLLPTRLQRLKNINYRCWHGRGQKEHSLSGDGRANVNNFLQSNLTAGLRGIVNAKNVSNV